MSKIRILSLVITTLLIAVNAIAQAPGDVIDKAASKLSAAKSIDCNFNISSNGNTISGSLVTSGKQFRIKTPQSSTWYDGKEMWTSNNKTKEITLVNPTSQELSETNPFSYLNTYKTDYTTSFSNRKDSRSYILVLTPKGKKSQVKSVEIAINKKTYLPEHFIIKDRNNTITKINITKLALKKTTNESFKCPVNTMKDYELIDLR